MIENLVFSPVLVKKQMNNNNNKIHNNKLSNLDTVTEAVGKSRECIYGWLSVLNTLNESTEKLDDFSHPSTRTCIACRLLQLL